jgi:hypothetical protein
LYNLVITFPEFSIENANIIKNENTKQWMQLVIKDLKIQTESIYIYIRMLRRNIDSILLPIA